MHHPSTLTLHRYRYGELAEPESAALRSHLEGCAACEGRLRAQENHRAAFELAPVPAAIREAAAPPAPRRRWGWLALLAPVMAALMVAVLPLTGAERVDPAQPAGDTRTKGADADMEVWLKGAGQLLDGDVVRPGDQVQFRYRLTEGDGWVTFAGEDASGHVEVYKSLPAQGEKGWQRAPFALTLDEAAGRQVFYAVFTRGRPSPSALADGLGRDGKPPDGRVESIRLKKAPSRGDE